MDKTAYQNLPSVDALLNQAEAFSLPHALKRNEARNLLKDCRQELSTGRTLTREQVESRFRERLETVDHSLRRVINASGVVLHTGLGRAPYSDAMLDAMEMLRDGYVNLELDLDSGRRGDRHDHLRPWLSALSGAEDGLLVNNNAAAVLLSLNTFADRKEVVVSRGQQVEIGGSFRIPEIIRKAGAKLVEVGTTNRTHSRDYRDAITPRTRILLWVHSSNYRVEGFTKEVALTEMVTIAHNHGLLCMADLGSGALTDIGQYGLLREPLVEEVVATGVDLVSFSVDKLLGGPQGGIVVGRKDLIRKLSKNNLLRALRPDKLQILLTREALRSYLEPGSAPKSLPTYRDFAIQETALQQRAEKLVEELKNPQLAVEIISTSTQVGSGASPLETIPSVALSLKHRRLSARTLARRLRCHDPAILGRIENDRVILDLRTVRSGEDKALLEALREV